MAALSPVRTPPGVVAIAEHAPIPLERAFERPPQLAVIVIDVQDPGNVGAIIRAAEAGGASGLVACGSSADPFGWKALRGAMGSAFRLPVARHQDPAAVLETARAKGLRLVATVPRAKRSLYGTDLAGPAALLVGSEGAGLSQEVAARTDLSVSIPMRPPVESLNVAVTTALVVYEAARQRGTFTGDL
jgi:TrmH family RNA methyltransferase